MTRRVVRFGLAAVMCAVALAEPVSAQNGPSPPPPASRQAAAVPQADLLGVVLDVRGEPLEGAVVSALGTVAVFAVSDAEGRFAFRSVPYGPYLVRAHLQGYGPARARLIQISRGPNTAASITLTRRADAGQPAPVLAAGIGPADSAGEVSSAGSGSETESHDHGEVAWRLRHLKRSILKEAAVGLAGAVDGSFLDDSLAGFSRAIGSPARLATALFAEVPWNGQLDLLTGTSFDRPEDLLSMQTWLPRGVAFLSLEAPTASGHWTVRGALTQGDLSSWIVAGSYRRAPAAHRYETGLSYGTQRYLGGNGDALAAVSDGDRNVGVVYAYDDWAVAPKLSVNYGARYARYDYLAEQASLSPRLAVTLTPRENDTLKLQATVSRRTLAPGAEEFNPPSSGLSLPPERTFSSLSRHGFAAERVDHLELAAEREWPGRLVTGVRVFRQRVDDQILTLFGAAVPGAAASLGHYYVASAGDFDATGWGVSMSRTIPGLVRASIDYTTADAVWVRPSPDGEALSVASVSALPDLGGRLHDITASVESTLPVTDTRVLVVYKINPRFADADAFASRGGPRFDVRLNQSLPFMRFSGAEWEMLVALRSLFRDDLLQDASIYDELLVMRSPKRVVGGVTVRF